MYQPVRYLDSALHRLGLAALIGGSSSRWSIGVLGRSWRVALVAVASVATSVIAALWVLYLRGDTLTSMTLIGLAAAMALVIDDAVGDVAALPSRLRQRRDDGQSTAVAVLTEAVTARRGPADVRDRDHAGGPGSALPADRAGGCARPPDRDDVRAGAVLASLVVALVVTPILVLLLVGDRPVGHSRFTRPQAWATRKLDGLSNRSVGRPLTAAVVLGVLALLVLPGILLLQDGDTLPAAQDRSVVVRLEAAPGTALTEMNRITTAAADELRTVPGVRTAGTHVGRAIASDQVADVNAGEIWVTIADDADYAGTLAGGPDGGPRLPRAAQPGQDLRGRPAGRRGRHHGRQARGPRLRPGSRHAAEHGRGRAAGDPDRRRRHLADRRSAR